MSNLMARRHFKVIAGVLHGLENDLTRESDSWFSDLVLDRFCNALVLTNSRFNRQKFETAVKTGKGL